jgi:hypothetical protein
MRKRRRREIAPESKRSKALGVRLRALARRISAEPWNVEGTDKSSVVHSWAAWWTLMDSIERADP